MLCLGTDRPRGQDALTGRLQACQHRVDSHRFWVLPLLLLALPLPLLLQPIPRCLLLVCVGTALPEYKCAKH